MALKQSSRAARKSVRVQQIDAQAAERPGALSLGWLWLPAVLLITAVAYWPSLRGPFIFDDYNLPFSDPHVATAPASFWIGGVRPVLMATYWANYILSGTQPFSYHAGNLLLHAITAGMVFFLLRRLLELAGIDTRGELLAFFGAGLFLLHPLQTESVAYIAGRSEVVAGLFYVAAWLAFLVNFRFTFHLRTALAILLLAGAAVAGKESAISLPAILFLTDIYWNPATVIEQVRSRATLYVPIVLGGALAAWKILGSLTSGTAAGFSSAGVTPVLYALTQCRVIPEYIKLFLLPIGQNGDWGLPFFQSLTDHAAWVWPLGMAALLVVIVATYRRARLFSFGLATFLVLLLPTSSFVPIKDAIAERRMYIPIIGLILALLWVLDYAAARLPALREPRTLGLAMLLILAVAGGLSFERSKVWSSVTLFWADSAGKNPANSRAHRGLGAGYMLDGRYADAIREFQTAMNEAGKSDWLTDILALAYQLNQQPVLALDQLRKIEHPTASTYDRIGYLQAVMGDAAGASVSFQTALELEPGNPTALKGMATLAAKH